VHIQQLVTARVEQRAAHNWLKIQEKLSSSNRVRHLFATNHLHQKTRLEPRQRQEGHSQSLLKRNVDRNGRKLAFAARQWRAVMKERLPSHGLTKAAWLPLLHIARQKLMLQKDLAEVPGIERSSLVRLIDALVAAGLAERKVDEDRRARVIALTPEGHDLVAKVETVSLEVRDQTLGSISDEALAVSFEVLDQISAALARQRG